MKYKSTIVLPVFLFISFNSFSQKSQIQIAQNAVGKLQVAIDKGQDKKQQLAIIGEGIKASENAKIDRKTKNWPETWAINAYLSSYVAMLDENQENADKYFNAAQESATNAVKLDKYHDNSKLIEAANFNLIVKTQDKGNKAFNSNDFKTAFPLLKKVSDFFPKDTTLAINTGIAAKNAQLENEELTYLKRAKDNGTKNPVIFQTLSKIYTSKFEKELAVKVLEDGIKVNPYNGLLTNDYINLLLDNEKYSQACQVIESTLSIDSKNKLLYFLYGYLQQLNNNNQAAESAYKNALTLDQNYFNALYQLGLTYINLANDALKSNKPENKQNFISYINKSQYALLQAHDINPNNRNTVQLLIDIYGRKNNLDKVQELRRELEEF